MSKLRLEKGKRALIVVAHPDDETIWMGGALLINPEVKWTIFSLCRASDEDRAPKFKKVCKRYGADCIITDLDDEGRLSDKEAIRDVQKNIIRQIGNKKFDYIFTHGQNGEYGHRGHKQVNKAVNNLISSKVLSAERIYYFNYKKDKKIKNKIVSGNGSDVIVKLSVQVEKEKKRIVSEIYGYPTGGIDVGYCTNPEAFKVISKLE